MVGDVLELLELVMIVVIVIIVSISIISLILVVAEIILVVIMIGGLKSVLVAPPPSLSLFHLLFLSLFLLLSLSVFHPLSLYLQVFRIFILFFLYHVFPHCTSTINSSCRANLSVTNRHWWLKAVFINTILFVILFFLTTPAVIINSLDLLPIQGQLYNMVRSTALPL